MLDGKLKQNIRKLTNYPIADYRLKVGDYRILFERDEKKEVNLLTYCSHRKDLY